MPFSDFQSAFDQMTDEFEYYNKIQELQSLRDPIKQVVVFSILIRNII